MEQIKDFPARGEQTTTPTSLVCLCITSDREKLGILLWSLFCLSKLKCPCLLLLGKTKSLFMGLVHSREYWSLYRKTEESLLWSELSPFSFSSRYGNFWHFLTLGLYLKQTKGYQKKKLSNFVCPVIYPDFHKV